MQPTHSGTTRPSAVTQNRTLRLIANAAFYPNINADRKAQVFAAVRANAGARANAAQHQKLLAERARLIPDFHVFRALVLEDLRQAYQDDRLHKTRAAKNRRLSWTALYKPFAALRGIDQALCIQALDRSGNYRCELIDAVPPPDQWQRFVKLGAVYGITEAQLTTLYRQQTRGKQRA